MNRKLFAVVCSVFVLSSVSPADAQSKPGDDAAVKQALDEGQKAFVAGDYASASAAFQKAISIDQRAEEAYFQLGITSLRTAKLDEAVSNLRRSFELNPNHTLAGVTLAEIFIMALNNQPLRAPEYLSEIQKVADKLLQLDPKSFDGLRLSGFVAAQDKDTNRALKLYQSANEVKPDRTEVIVPWAMLLAQNRREGEAEAKLTDFLKVQKNSPQAYDLLYTLFLHDRRAEDGEKTLKAKVEAMPDHPEYRAQLAAHYLNTKNKTALNQQLAILSKAGPDGNGHLLAGDFLLNSKDYDGAQKEYEAGIEAGGKTKVEIQKHLINLYVTQNKLPEASRIAGQVLKENPNDVDAQTTQAALQVNSGDLETIKTALATLKRLVDANPQNFRTHYELARAYIALAQKTGDADQVNLANGELEASLKLRPDFGMAKLLYAQLAANRKDYTKALDVTDEILARDPKNTPAMLIRTSSWIGQQQYEKAGHYLKAILAESPNLQDALAQLGEVYRLQGDDAKAEATFRDLRKAYPSDQRAWIGIWQTLQGAKRYKDAIAFLNEEITTHPDNEGARLRLGSVYVLDKQFDKATEQFRILVKLHPGAAHLYASIADTLRQKGDFPGAIANFRKAVELSPPGDSSGIVALAMTLEESGNKSEARTQYEKALTVQSNNFVALNNLAFLKAEEGSDLDGALAMALKARELAPNVDTIADTLAFVYIRKKVPDEAINILTDVTAKDPDNVSYLYHLAQAYELKGDKAKAKQQCEAGLSKIKAKPENAKYEQKLRDLLKKVS